MFFALAGVYAGVSLLVPLLGVAPRNLIKLTPSGEVAKEGLETVTDCTGQAALRQLREMGACFGALFRVRTFLAVLAANSVWVICNGGVGFMVVYFQVASLPA